MPAGRPLVIEGLDTCRIQLDAFLTDWPVTQPRLGVGASADNLLPSVSTPSAWRMDLGIRHLSVAGILA